MLDKIDKLHPPAEKFTDADIAKWNANINKTKLLEDAIDALNRAFKSLDVN